MNNNNLTNEIFKNDLEVSLQIKRYINENRLKQAEQLALLHQDNDVIISQLITIYTKECEYDKAEALAKKYPDNERKVGQLITIYIRQKRYNEAEELAKKYPNDKTKNCQLIIMYKKQNKLEEAEQLALKFPDDRIIVGELIEIYIIESRLKDARKLAERVFEKYPKDSTIAGQLINIYIRENELELAEELAKKYPNDIKKAGQLITIYIKQKKYNKAEELAKKYPYDKSKMCQLMKIFIKQNRLNDANELVTLNPNNEKIIGQLITYYKDHGQYEEAKLISEIGEKSQILVSRQLNLSEKAANILYSIRAKIVASTIELSNIEMLNTVKDEIGEEKYNLILAAIYEKLNYKSKSISLLKQINNPSQEIKNILISINNKQRFYNLEKWDQVIGWYNEKCEEFIEEEMKIETEEPKKEDAIILKSKKITKNNDNINQPNLPITRNAIVIQGTPKKSEVIKKPNEKKENISLNNKEQTIYASLSNKYKLIVCRIKLDYYIKMNIIETQKEYIEKYDHLVDLLLCRSNNNKAFDKVLLYFYLENYRIEMEEKDIARCNELIDNAKSRLLTKK